ncbi:MAG: SgcJ/EcaC family oxidoreductase [Gemmatimonadaceae bacterium]
MPFSFRRLLAVVTLIVVALAAPQNASAQPSNEQLQRANALFAQPDWQGAFDAYSALASQFPRHPLSRFRVGVTLLELRRYAEAETNLRDGERLGFPTATAAFRLGQLFAETGRADSAIAELARAAAAGMFTTTAALEGDRHLSRLRSHPKWPDVVDAFDAVLQPCHHDARFRELDFWLGDWDVRPTGQPASAAAGPPARNTVTLEDNGCVVVEHWTAPGGSRGQSFNLFDRSVGKWRQTWVDNAAGQHDYRGELKDGNMAYVGDTPAPNGQLGRVPTRLTFFRLGNDSVRQFSEISNDSGRTWQSSYDLMYVRRVADRAALTDADRAAIRALNSAFVRGWLKDDTAAVLSLFASDAVLVPPGHSPVVGRAAIKAYWWPADGSHTRITSFTRTIDDIGGGGGDFALVRGTANLSWQSDKGGQTTRQTTRSTELLLLSRDGGGQWRVIRQMWDPVRDR